MELKYKKLWLLLGVLGIIFTFVVCLIPTPKELNQISHSDKVLHLLTYLILGIWFFQLYFNKKNLICFISLVLMGDLIEVLQYLLPYRSFSLLDMAFNSAGVLVALFLSLSLKSNIFSLFEKRIL